MAAVVLLALAALMLALAVDVSRWRTALAEGDVRYRVAPADAGLWRPAEVVGLGIASRVLGVRDDVAYREAVRALRVGRIDGPFVTDPRLALLRTEGHGRLSAIADGDGDRRRRSAARNLLGVLALVSSAAEHEDRDALLREAVASFERAIALDPRNADAKHNLELALQRGRGLSVTEPSGGANPAPGGGGAKGAGAGDPGSGY